jgi:hypothetical protein
MNPRSAMSGYSIVPETLGMLAGFALDVRGAGPQLIMSQCGADGGSGLLQTLTLHMSELPAMYIGVVAASLGAASLRRVIKPRFHLTLRADFLRSVACTLWMLGGMTFGTILCGRMASGFIEAVPSSLRGVIMLGAMIFGMACSMIALTVCTRLTRTFCRASIFTT